MFQEKKGSQKSTGKKTAKKGENNGPLLVHVLPQKPKNRGKKHKKVRILQEILIYVISNADIRTEAKSLAAVDFLLSFGEISFFLQRLFQTRIVVLIIIISRCHKLLMRPV